MRPVYISARVPIVAAAKITKHLNTHHEKRDNIGSFKYHILSLIKIRRSKKLSPIVAKGINLTIVI